ncbi:MAG: hypothetical protein HOH13_05755 [Crocinitomicaceae bacterium]|nr:hypothetical protein [Crocinitomicaceae bacterium]
MNLCKFLIGISFIFSLTGCKKVENRRCFKNIGNITVESRSLKPYSFVVLDDHIDLILTDTTDNSIVVESGANLIGFIVTEVSNDTLFIRDDNRCSFLRDLNYKTKVFLNSLNLNKVLLYGSGNLSNETPVTKNITIDADRANGNIDLTLECDSCFFIVNVGVTNIKLVGTCADSYFYYFGHGDVDASQLISTKAAIHWNSTGWLKLNATNSINGVIESSGNVYYSGNPTIIDVAMTGSGELIPQ